jgi:hypothetical protein
VGKRSGVGQYNLTEKDAIAEIEKLAKEFPLATYWIESERPPPLNLKGHRCSYGDLTFIASKSPEASPV